MTHNWKRWLAPGAAITAAAVLAACSSSSTSSSSSAPATSSSPAASTSASASASGAASSTTDAGLAKAQQMVSQLESTTSSYPVPTASISGVSGLKGKTVYYIPLVQFIPGFVVTAATMKVALAKVGLNLQVCNGQGQPSAIASCVQQATGAGAAGIITDAIPYGMAQNALDAAKAKGIPIIITDQYPPAGNKNTDAVTYVPGVVDQPSQIAWWMIANSQGKANAILAQESDSPSSIAYVQNSLSIYKDNCPGCTVTVKSITATTNSQLASDTSANLLSNPNATYYYTEFEDSLDPTVQGLQQSNKTDIALSVAGGSVDGLGRLKSGAVVKAVVAVDQAYAGWALTDEILRMATKAAPVAEPFPSRLFTAQNIGSIKVTTAAQASGEWFGDSSYQTDFAKLWGV
ncbi:sugar ABC transporter substrate-binding protein [Trebonia kvetii]|uniref:Sugar ABC transporter substrate-binding protein n=1 Tax=Trebonia kvetii TaxID=2480626 RepID=A0A6P2BZ49_9ACTN|nr:substrate-binding domain-containing protein [Trebonia kvetii]TVZ04354.1 sugar ABC transporter substrate-binding protein [Trebonia kvetii]